MRKPPTKFGLFTVVFPDEQAAARIEALVCRVRRDCRLKVKPLLTSRFHVSLNNLGEYADRGMAEAVALKACEAAAGVRVNPFTVMFNLLQRQFTGRAGQRALVLRGDDGVVGLEILYRSLTTAMRMAGFKSPLHFTPHLTLSYGEQPIEERFIEPISWTVREFALILSLAW